MDLPILFTLFSLGLVSSAHCIGMCGGIMGALTMAIPAEAKAQRWLLLTAYNLGRIGSYAFMGLLAGFFAEKFASMGGSLFLRVLAGALLIAMGLYLADWWRGLTRLEAIGRYLWVYIQPLGKPLMPVNSAPKALLLGAVWGWLPCGLVYSALAVAMTQPAPYSAGGAMLAFGLGTLPAVMGAGIAAQHLARLLQRRKIRVGLALIVILFGLWTIGGSFVHIGEHQHHSSHEQSIHTHPSSQDNTEQPAQEHRGSEHQHEGPSTATTPASERLERQRTDADKKLEDDKSSKSSSVEGDYGAHHH